MQYAEAQADTVAHAARRSPSSTTILTDRFGENDESGSRTILRVRVRERCEENKSRSDHFREVAVNHVNVEYQTNPNTRALQMQEFDFILSGDADIELMANDLTF